MAVWAWAAALSMEVTSSETEPVLTIWTPSVAVMGAPEPPSEYWLVKPFLSTTDSPTAPGTAAGWFGLTALSRCGPALPPASKVMAEPGARR